MHAYDRLSFSRPCCTCFTKPPWGGFLAWMCASHFPGVSRCTACHIRLRLFSTLPVLPIVEWCLVPLTCLSCRGVGCPLVVALSWWRLLVSLLLPLPWLPVCWSSVDACAASWASVRAASPSLRVCLAADAWFGRYVFSHACHGSERHCFVSFLFEHCHLRSRSEL